MLINLAWNGVLPMIKIRTKIQNYSRNGYPKENQVEHKIINI